MGAAAAAAISLGSGRFFRSNQNTYLLHAVGPSFPSLDGDWLLGTSDAFAVFTAVVRPVHEFAGEPGLAVLTSFAGLVAFLSMAAIAFLATLDTTPGHRTAVALATTVAVAAVQRLPAPLVDALPGPTPPGVFHGFGGQYLLSEPGMLQPSDAGVFLLAAAALCIAARSQDAHRRLVLLRCAAGLAITTCVVHPTYVAPLVLALCCIALADRVLGERLARPRSLAATGLIAVVAVLATNPVARAALGGGRTDARRFLAFERIPHHSLISHWHAGETAVTALIIAAGALASVRSMRSWWVAIVMWSTLVSSLAAAIVVELTRNATIASAFPWRISVVVAPMAVVFLVARVVARVVDLVRRVLADRRAVLATGLAACGLVACGLVVLGVRATVRALDTPPTELVATLRAADLSGTGWVPLDADDIRLNARLPVFVDWKSHPYAPDELDEWVRRVRAAEDAAANDDLFCELVVSESIDWVVSDTAAPPGCLTGWPSIEGEGFVLRRRP